MAISANVLFTALAVNSVLQAGTTPARFSTSGSYGGSIYGISGGNSLSTVINRRTINGECVDSVDITGEIIKDTFLLPCSNHGLSVQNGNTLMIGDPKTNPVTLFSSDSSTLVIIKNGTCTKKTYTNVNGERTNTSSNMTDEECALVKKRIEEEQEKTRIYWQEWSRNFQEQMRKAFPPGFPFN